MLCCGPFLQSDIHLIRMHMRKKTVGLSSSLLLLMQGSGKWQWEMRLRKEWQIVLLLELKKVFHHGVRACSPSSQHSAWLVNKIKRSLWKVCKCRTLIQYISQDPDLSPVSSFQVDLPSNATSPPPTQRHFVWAGRRRWEIGTSIYWWRRCMGCMWRGLRIFLDFMILISSSFQNVLINQIYFLHFHMVHQSMSLSLIYIFRPPVLSLLHEEYNGIISLKPKYLSCNKLECCLVGLTTKFDKHTKSNAMVIAWLAKCLVLIRREEIEIKYEWCPSGAPNGPENGLNWYLWITSQHLIHCSAGKSVTIRDCRTQSGVWVSKSVCGNGSSNIPSHFDINIRLRGVLPAQHKGSIRNHFHISSHNEWKWYHLTYTAIG